MVVKMTKIANYRLLFDKVTELNNSPQTCFYIGHTGKGTNAISNYLLHTEPKSLAAHGTIQTQNLVKSKTYYVHLDGNSQETEAAMIGHFCAFPGNSCLNSTEGPTNATANGIVYVLQYTPA